VGAIGHASPAVLTLARDFHVAPSRPRREDHRRATERRAALELDLVELARDEASRTLALDEVDCIRLHVSLEARHPLRPLGVRDGDEVLDGHRVEDLAAEALGDDPRAE